MLDIKFLSDRFVVLFGFFFTFQHFKYIIPPPSSLHGLIWDINLIEDPLHVMTYFFLDAFKRLTVMCLGMISLSLSYLEFTEPLGYVD